MSKMEKLIKKLVSLPKDFTYEEFKLILNNFGFSEYNKGKTSGSRVLFMNKEGYKINLHKPHPSNILKIYQLKELISKLEEWGFMK